MRGGCTLNSGTAAANSGGQSVLELDQDSSTQAENDGPKKQHARAGGRQRVLAPSWLFAAATGQDRSQEQENDARPPLSNQISLGRNQGYRL